MKNTFGGSKAAQRLESLLENNQPARRKVSRLLSSYTNKLFNVTGAKDPETVLTCMELLREQTLKRVDALQALDTDVRSYTKNLVSYRYRRYRSAFEDLVPVLRRMIEKERLTSKRKGV